MVAARPKQKTQCAKRKKDTLYGRTPPVADAKREGKKREREREKEREREISAAFIQARPRPGRRREVHGEITATCNYIVTAKRIICKSETRRAVPLLPGCIPVIHELE